MSAQRALRQSIVGLLSSAAAMLDTLGRLTQDGAPSQAAQAVRHIAAQYRDPVSPDWRYDYPDERRS